MKAFVCALAFFLCSHYEAVASTVFSQGDWALDDSNPNKPDDGICSAATSAYLGSAIYSLQLALDKAGTRPLEIYVRPRRSPSAVTAFKTQLEGGALYYFAKLPAIAGQDYFWNLPRGTEAFVQALRDNRRMVLAPLSGASGSLSFSLSGATATIHELERRCATQSLFTAHDFENEFLPPSVASPDATRLSPELMNQIRTMMLKGVGAYKVILAIGADLAALEEKFAPLTSERTALISAIDTLRNQTLPALAAGHAAAQAAIDGATADIEATRAEIASQRVRLEDANNSYQSAYSRFKPLIPERSRLFSLVQAAGVELKAALAKLAAADENIAKKRNEIAHLEGEYEKLYGTLSGLQQKERAARAAAVQAEQDLRNFNFSTEVEKRRQASKPLARVNQEIADLGNAISNQGKVVDNAQLFRDQKLEAYKMCMGTKRDCSVEKTALAAAERQLSDSKALLAQQKKQLEDKGRQRLDILAAIDQDVRDLGDSLAEKAADTKQAVADLDKQIQAANGRLQVIEKTELPKAQAELAGLNSQRETAFRSLTQAQDKGSLANDNLQGFLLSSHYEELRIDTETAAATVTSIWAEINRLSQQILADQAAITKNTAERETIAKQLVAAQALLATKQARLAEVQTSLVPFEQQKAEIQGRLAQAHAALKGVSNELDALIPR